MAKKNLSALKRVRQSEKRRRRNQFWKSTIKTFTKKVEAAISAGDKETAEKMLRETIRIICKARSKGVLHRNTASRKISRITKKVNKAFRSEAA
ncbi:MAG: 30S ribosomal protein S20 [Nitrospirae bacterium]|nr:30S ribosomal protein S20 [Nitrospirota bacterium]